MDVSIYIKKMLQMQLVNTYKQQILDQTLDNAWNNDYVLMNDHLHGDMEV